MSMDDREELMPSVKVPADSVSELGWSPLLRKRDFKDPP
jgi:hypothetical protein